MTVLVLGGAGYIGSHVVLELVSAGHDVLVVDNLSNSNEEAIRRVERLTRKRIFFLKGDIRDKIFLKSVFQGRHIESVVLLAGLKSVSDSVSNPIAYYSNNVEGAISLLDIMAQYEVFKIIFSSSSTVYGVPKVIPILESHPVARPCTPYGNSKLIVESVLQDIAKSDSRWSVALLRYFNPAGAHSSGIIGEDPRGVPNNLIPYISQVAIGKRKELSVFGNDYSTIDGTGVRDYIHVMDLAKGHVAAMNFIIRTEGVHIWNLGTGVGYSVLQIIAAFERVSGKKIPYKIVPRRPGDIAECWSSPGKAKAELDWIADLSLLQMMEDAWRWQSMNPNGYR